MAQLRDYFPTIGGFSHNFYKIKFFEQCPEAFSNQVVIVGEEEGDFHTQKM